VTKNATELYLQVCCLIGPTLWCKSVCLGRHDGLYSSVDEGSIVSVVSPQPVLEGYMVRDVFEA